ncbi:MAG: methyltransferase [Sphingobacteriaceae bacterium]|nr:methyltransferase [Sphingobacteriaceae bacterium]
MFFCNSCSSSVTEKSLNGIKTGRLLYQDNFEKLSSHWVIETPSNKNSKVYTDSGKLIIDVAAGATVWFNKKLSGNYLISYTRKVVVNKRVNDRLSDFNQFWMASDPKNTNLFTRTGVFEEYDSLSLYYMGMGGNTNTTTRFRKYFGDGSKPLLKEYLDKGHLLQPNKEYLITLVVKNGLSECFVNGQKYFSYKDEVPLVEGYFGFRTTWSRQEVSNFKIFSLK